VGFYLSMTDDTLEIIFALIKQLESTMLGLRQLRELVGKGVAQHMVDELIQEGEIKLTELKRRLIQ
jgi:hypothetical protein